jgi:hypothetical protein
MGDNSKHDDGDYDINNNKNDRKGLLFGVHWYSKGVLKGILRRLFLL